MPRSNNYKSENSLQLNLYQQKKKAFDENDKEKLVIIERLEIEIEKLLIIQQVRENQKLLNLYRDDINNIMQEGTYNLIEMILLKEIELLSIGDFEAIEMLNKLKKNAQDKIKKLSEIAIKNHQNHTKFDNSNSSPKPIYSSNPEKSYKPITLYEGFHLEKTLGGEFIQALDADIKNLVGNEILNSKPEQLSKNIIDEIRNIRQGGVDLNDEVKNLSDNIQNNNVNKTSSIIKKTFKSSQVSVDYNIKGEWTDLISTQEKQKTQGVEIGNSEMVRKK